MPWEKKKTTKQSQADEPHHHLASPSRHGAREGAGEGGTDGSPTDEPQLCSRQVPTTQMGPSSGKTWRTITTGTRLWYTTRLCHIYKMHTHTSHFWFPSKTLRYRVEVTCHSHTAIKWQGQNEAQVHIQTVMDNPSQVLNTLYLIRVSLLQPTKGLLLAGQGNAIWRVVELLKFLILSTVLSPVSQPGGVKKMMSKHLHRSAKCWAGAFPKMTTALAPRPDDSHPVGPIHSVWIWGK